MPRYVYRCDSCGEYFQVRHGMSDTQESCEMCNESGFLVRVPQMPIIKKETQHRNQSVGKLTNNAIEENRELLSKMKKEARSQVYED